MATFELQERAPQPAVVIRLHTTVAEIPVALGAALPEVWQAAEAITGAAPDGPPFARYLSPFSEPGDAIDYEAGVLLRAPAGVGSGRAVPVELPGGVLAVGWHVGPYETLAETYGALMAWIVGRGKTIAGPMWELYWTDPGTEPDPSRWRTEVVVPVA